MVNTSWSYRNIYILNVWWVVGFNNRAITLKEDSKTSWGNVESSYQRRNDLIGNLVNTVSGVQTLRSLH
jgi:LemA protein